MKSTLSVLKKYKIISIYAKNFILLFFSIVIPVFLTVSIFTSVYCNSINRSYERDNSNQFNTLTSISDKIFEQVNANMALIYSNSYVNQFFSIGFNNFIETQKFNFEIQSLEKTFSINESNFNSIIMYSAKNNLVYNQSTVNFDYFAQTNPDYADTLQNTTSITVKKTYIDSVDCVTVFLPIWSYSSERGTICYNLSTDKLKYYFSNIINIDNLININFLFDGKSIFNYENSETIKQSTVYETTSKYYYLKYKFTMSNAEQIKNIRLIKTAICIFILIILISVLILAFLLSAKAYMPISTLMEVTQSPELWANNHIITNGSPQNELEYIIAKLCNSIDFSGDSTARAAMLKRTHTVALQSQITPHFLYNTLAAINMAILETVGDDCTASDMVVTLSDYLRYTFKINNIVIPLSTELSFAQKYVEIMKYRYGNKISFIVNHDKSLDNVNVIKLSLQPIIENAIYHGIIPSDSGCGTITVSDFKRKHSLIVCVENTGKIISYDEIIKIENMLNNQSDVLDEHIGIINVDKRIKYTFGNGYGIKVSATKTTTKFELSFPCNL